jgi:hypothetical protein
MAIHLPGKTARLISDFLTIDALAALIPHEMEKRIVARHGLIKLDALLSIAPRYKNELRARLGATAVAPLNEQIARLRNDYVDSSLNIGRDAMSAHSLHLDLRRVVDTWTVLNQTVFSVIASDLREINTEIIRLDANYPQAQVGSLDAALPVAWSEDELLGDPRHVRFAVIYGSLATAGIIAPVAGGAPVQDATIRVGGLMTFINQLDRLRRPLIVGSNAERLIVEMIVIDFLALWEALFSSTLRNEHGNPDRSLLDQWRSDGWLGVTRLEALEQAPHPDLQLWRTQVRDRTAAHIDPDIDIWLGDIANWPMTADALVTEAYRVMNAVHRAASMEIRAKPFFMPPCRVGGDEVIGLGGQAGRRWHEG